MWGFSAAQLPPLTTDELVDMTGSDTDDNQTLCILADYTGGNPRILLEQIAQQQDDQLRGTAPLLLPPRATPTVEQVTVGYLATMSAAARRVLELVALVPMAHLSAIGTVLPEAADDVEDLINTGILRRRGQYISFSDLRLRSRLYWDQGSKLAQGASWRARRGVRTARRAPRDLASLFDGQRPPSCRTNC